MPHIWMMPLILKDFHKQHLTWRCNSVLQPYCEANDLIPISKMGKLRLWKHKWLEEGYVTHRWSFYSKPISLHQFCALPATILCWFSPGLKSKQSSRGFLPCSIRTQTQFPKCLLSLSSVPVHCITSNISQRSRSSCGFQLSRHLF